MKKLSIYTTEQNKTKLNAIAKSYGISTNKLINLMISQFIITENERIKLELTKAGVQL